jgi:hypothetical protein
VKAGIAKASSTPGKGNVATIPRPGGIGIKMVDDLEAAKQQVRGVARSMGTVSADPFCFAPELGDSLRCPLARLTDSTRRRAAAHDQSKHRSGQTTSPGDQNHRGIHHVR